jgi:hypothetical protein
VSGYGLVKRKISERTQELFFKEIKAMNIDLLMFASSLRKQRVKIVEVDWEIPAEEDETILKIVEKVLG